MAYSITTTDAIDGINIIVADQAIDNTLSLALIGPGAK